MSASSVTLHTADLTALVGDNSAQGSHAAGYNGLWSLTHRAQPANLFVPTYAGLNLEHILNGQTTSEPAVFFEPRKEPMTLRLLDERTAELHQSPTSLTRVESWSRLGMVEPDGIDFSFRAVPHTDIFPRGYLAFFWASYIQAPLDKSMYFIGRNLDRPSPPSWMQLCTQAHGVHSTVCRGNGVARELPNDVVIPGALMHAFSPMVWDEPFFYGQSHNMTLLMMFDLGDALRLTHSPSGGGYSAERHATHPAWDFQFVVDRPRVGEAYEFHARIIYRPTMTREAILAQVEEFKRR